MLKSAGPIPTHTTYVILLGREILFVLFRWVYTLFIMSRLHLPRPDESYPLRLLHLQLYYANQLDL